MARRTFLEAIAQLTCHGHAWPDRCRLLEVKHQLSALHYFYDGLIWTMRRPEVRAPIVARALYRNSMYPVDYTDHWADYSGDILSRAAAPVVR